MGGRRSIGRLRSKNKAAGSSSKGRKLVRWDADLDVLLLLTVQVACNKNGVKIPWEKVAEMMGENFTEGAIVQHLTKLRLRRQADHKPIPPALRRSALSMSRSNKRRKARDDDDSDLFVSQSDAEDPPYPTRKAKKPRVSKGNMGSKEAACAIVKEETSDDSDLQLVGSVSDEAGSFSDLSLGNAHGSRKKKLTQEKKTLIVRLPVRKSYLYQLKLDEAKKEEEAMEGGTQSIQGFGEDANMTYPPPPRQQPAQLGLTHQGQYQDPPGTGTGFASLASPCVVGSEGMAHPEIRAQGQRQARHQKYLIDNPFAIENYPMGANPQMLNTPFESSPVPARPYQHNLALNDPGAEFQTPPPRQSQSKASQFEASNPRCIDPAMFARGPYAKPFSDIPMSDAFLEGVGLFGADLNAMSGDTNPYRLDFSEYVNEDMKIEGDMDTSEDTSSDKDVKDVVE